MHINDFVQLIYAGRQILMETKINYIDGDNMFLMEEDKLQKLVSK